MGDDAQKETAGKGDAHPTGRNGLRLLSLVMVIDLMSLSVQIPTMVRAYETYEIDLRMQGWLAGTFGLISFFVAPVLGRVSDSMGRVTMLKVSAVGGLLGSFGSFYARGKWAFIAARTLPAMLKCSLPISQAYIVDTSEGNAERSKNLSLLSASIGMAFVLGPPLGGLMADYHLFLPFVLSGVLGIILLGLLTLLPEPTKHCKEEEEDVGNGSVGGGKRADKKSPSRMSVFRGPGGKEMGWGFHDRLVVVVAESIYHSTFSTVLIKVLGFPGSMIGLILSYMGLLSALTNAFLIGKLTKRFKDRQLMIGGLLAQASGWIMWSSVVSFPSILVALGVVSVGGNVFQMINKAAVAHLAPPDLVGTVMGMSGALDTFGRAAGGPLSGYIYDACGPSGLPLVCAALTTYVASVLGARGLGNNNQDEVKIDGAITETTMGTEGGVKAGTVAGCKVKSG